MVSLFFVSVHFTPQTVFDIHSLEDTQDLPILDTSSWSHTQSLLPL